MELSLLMGGVHVQHQKLKKNKNLRDLKGFFDFPSSPQWSEA